MTPANRVLRHRRRGRLAAQSVVVLLAACLSGTGPADSDSCSLLGCDIPTVPEVLIVGPSATPYADTVQVGGSAQLVATVRTRTGVLPGRSFQWRALDESKATVSATGLVTGVGVGRVEITATAIPDPWLGRIFIDVHPGPVAWLAIWPQAASIRRGESRTLVARAFDRSGFEVPGVPIDWSSTDPTIATVSSSGVVDGVAAGGPIAIVASARGKAISAIVSVTPAAAITFVQMALGSEHSCGLTSAGQVYCWGSNRHNQLGDSTGIDHPTIAPVLQGALEFVELVAGSAHSCARTRSGQAYCWGSNSWGELGDNSRINRFAPVPVAQGGVVFSALTAGSGHTCGLTTAGTAYCWGFNNTGGLGVGSTELQRSTPTQVVDGGLRFRLLAAGNDFTCALAQSGRAYCWGVNGSGQLGDGTTVMRTTPTAVVQRESIFTTLGAGTDHACGIASGGQALCWGVFGAISPPLPFPSPALSTGQGLAAVSATGGTTFHCGISTSGRPVCWGFDLSGQLGGDTTPNDPSVPVLVDLGTETAAGVASGAMHACAWTPAGKAFCWGVNENGRLGDGTSTTRYRPVPVRVP